MKSMLKDAAVLFIITLIAGASLGFVYDVTKAPIALARENAQNEAFKEVFSDAAEFLAGEDAFSDIPTDPFSVDWKENGFSDVVIERTYHALSEGGEELGFVMLITTYAGYGGDISFAMGIKNDGTINGISILDISETAGLGMRAQEVLAPQFANKDMRTFIVTKQGAGSDAEIDAISGATITSKAVTTAVNAGIYYFDTILGGRSDAE